MKPDRRSVLRQLGYLGIGCCLGSGCRTAPVTGRPQLLVMSEAQEILLGAQAFQETLVDEAPSQNTRLSSLVNRVGQRIASVADRDDYQWEFRLFANPTQNAFCLPGGKVAIYDGILSVCEDEAGLAVVMSHEIAHALARHGGERISQNMAVDRARQIAERFAGSYAPENKEILMRAYGVGSKYGVLLPYSRKQESEADHIGLTLMAQAGYDPNVAPGFWTRFGSQKQGGELPEFMSTHPADSRRAHDLTALKDEANLMYANASTQYGRGESVLDQRPVVST